ncbi:MAG: HAMP domain-containing protein, partial [Sterolibacterium sp.]
MFKNMRVAMKLGFGFGVVILLAIALGAVSLMQVHAIGGVWDDFETVTLKKRDAATKGLQGLQDGIHYFKNFVLRGGDYAKKFGNAMTSIDHAVADYRKAGALSADEDKLLLQIAEGANVYRKAIEDAQRLAAERQTSNQIDQAIKGADKELNQGLIGLLEINAKRTQDAATGIRAVVATASLWIAVLSVAILALGILAAWMIGRSITRPLAMSVAAANAIATGDLTQRIEVDSKDETGQLMAAMMRMSASIQALVTDANGLASAAVDGKLATRADAAKHQGEFRAIVEGINRTLDRLVGFLDNMPAPVAVMDREFNIQYINRIGAAVGGKTPQQLTNTKCYDFFKAEDCRTDRCACARAMSSGELCSGETHVCPGSASLDIAYSGLPLRGLDGAIVGVMEIVTDQTAVKQASRVSAKMAAYQETETKKLVEGLGELARGNLDFSVVPAEADGETQSVKAAYDEIAAAINRSVGAIQLLVKDANLLAAAAVEGRLDTRADAGKHQGDFRKIVEGVNATLDGVILPLNEA